MSAPLLNMARVPLFVVMLTVGMHVLLWLMPSERAVWLWYLSLVPQAYVWFDFGETWALWTQPLGVLLVHVDWLHLTLNMSMVAAFGTMMARMRGEVFVGLLYVGGGLASSVALIALHHHEPQTYMGASGAVFALLGGVLALSYAGGFPFGRAQAMVMLLMVVGVNILVGTVFEGFLFGGQIAWDGHLAGLGAGWVLTLLLERRWLLYR